MTEPIEIGFLKAVAEQPDDKVHCAVYADWLEEQGNRPADAAWWRYRALHMPKPCPSRTGKTVEWWLERPEFKLSMPWEVPLYIWGLLAVRDRRHCRPATCNYPGAPRRYVARYRNGEDTSRQVAMWDITQAFYKWWEGSRGFLRGKRIWSGDEWCDIQAGCPGVYQIWQEKFGEKLELSQALHKEDFGDAFLYFMPNNHCVCLACDGNYIYETAQTGVPK